MTDIHQPMSDSSYSYRSIRFYCQNCQRQFSELSLSNTSSPQARCPRCNLYADPAPPQPTQQQSTRNNQNSRSNNNSNRTTNPNTTRPNRPQQQATPNTQGNPFGFFGQQMNNPFNSGLFQDFGIPAGFQNQGRGVSGNSQNNQGRSANNNSDPFSQMFGNFFGGTTASRDFGFGGGFGGINNAFNGFNPFGQANAFSQPTTSAQTNAFGQANAFNVNNNNMYNDFGPAMPDDMVIEEFLRDDPNEHGPPPASEAAINKLKEIRFDPAGKEEGSENMCCPVCQEDYKKGEKLVRLPCKHDYHRECVEPWLFKHNSCPMCRVPI